MRLNVAAGPVVTTTAVPRPFAAAVPNELPVAEIGSVCETELKVLMSRFPAVIAVPLKVIWPEKSGWADPATSWKTPWPVNPVAKLPAPSATEEEHAAAAGTHCWEAVAG